MKLGMLRPTGLTSCKFKFAPTLQHLSIPHMIYIILMSITYNTSQVLGVTSGRLPGRGLGSKSNLNQRGIGNSKTTDFGEESLSSRP